MAPSSAFIAAPILACCAAFGGVVPASAAPSASTNSNAVRVYAGVLHRINPKLPAWQSATLAKHLLSCSRRWRVDASVLAALVSVESGWHTHARSRAGALGLGQLMPGTAHALRVNPNDPYQNLQGSARYLHAMLMRFNRSPHRFSLAFAAYNAGPRAVSAYGGIPPYAETQRYVVKVTRAWRKIARAVTRSSRITAHAASPVVESPDLKYWSAPSR